MEVIGTMSVAEKVALLNGFGTGYRSMDDLFFAPSNELIFKKFVRLGVYRYDDESSCHKTNFVRCHIPNCNQRFDSVFAYESHYNSLHRFLCAQCSKNLPSAHLLDLHLEERHDSFFAVQADRKPMYRCYLEECTHRSQTPSERRDHCISQHKFPHDFRFDGYNYPGKKSNSKNTSKPKTSVNTDASKTSTIVQPSKLMSTSVHEEDIELENKSILLTAQRRPVTSFSFGHKQTKAFASPDQHSYAKQLTKKSKNQKKSPQSALEDVKMVDDLMESLPQ